MIRKSYFIIALVIVFLALSFLYGVLVGIRKYPPYGLLQNAYMRFFKSYEFEESNFVYMDLEASSLISIDSKEDIFQKRREFISYIWGGETLPDFMPHSIEKNISDNRYADLTNLAAIDKIIVSMEYELNSIIYHFRAARGNNRLLIYHQGHGGDFIAGKNTIKFFLDKGYSVMAFSMPLGGMNSTPTADTRIFGELKLTKHEYLKFLQLEEGSPIKFFIEPIVVALNYAESFGYDDISMTGLSGGGWTAVLYSAVDPRISQSYPVAGSLPIYLRDLSFEGGDYEQSLAGLYQAANYLELYILGSYGGGRRQLQIFNKYDSCCFAGERYKAYEDEIKNAISNLGGGSFGVYLDDTHREHKISSEALNVIINDLEYRYE